MDLARTILLLLEGDAQDRNQERGLAASPGDDEARHRVVVGLLRRGDEHGAIQTRFGSEVKTLVGHIQKVHSTSPNHIDRKQREHARDARENMRSHADDLAERMLRLQERDAKPDKKRTRRARARNLLGRHLTHNYFSSKDLEASESGLRHRNALATLFHHKRVMSRPYERYTSIGAQGHHRRGDLHNIIKHHYGNTHQSEDGHVIIRGNQIRRSLDVRPRESRS